MNVESLDDCGQTTGVYYDISGKAYQLEPTLQNWSDRWVAHRLGDYIELERFMENPAVIFLKLAARADFALHKRKNQMVRIRHTRRLLEGGKHASQSH